jgi:uncharacterized membrane protein
VSKPKSRPKQELQSSELWLVRACLAVALGISLFLAWSSLAGGGVPGCGPASGCDKVLTSRWAYVAGLPISLFALPVYVALLALLRKNENRWTALVTLSVLVIASAAWFAGVQAVTLRAFCKFCMTAHAAGVIASLVLLRNAQPVKLPVSLGTALGGMAVLIVAQVLGPEQTARQVTYAPASSPAPVTAGPAASAAAATNAAPVPHPALVTNALPEAVMFSILGGEFTLDLAKLPVSGPVHAPKKVAKLFDYTCHHCRDLHHLLSEFRNGHSNELAVISLPLPLDSNCNPVVKRTPAAHVNACQYAKFGLAVFHANPVKFEEFTDWIYANARPPALEQAREYARQLVGAKKFDAALQNPAIEEQIRIDVAIYKAAYRKTRSGALPQMYFEQGASIGAVETREALQKIMHNNLGL